MSWFMVGAAVVSAFGTIAQGRQQDAAAQSQANMDEYNAKMSQMQAEQTYAQAGAQEDLQRKRARAAVSKQLASNAQAGGGLNTDLLRESLYGAEADALAIRYDGDLKAHGLSSQADLQRSNASMMRSQGKQAKQASYLSAAGSLMKAGASYYGGGGTLNNSRTLRLGPGEE